MADPAALPAECQTNTLRVALPHPVHQIAPNGILIAYQRIYTKMSILSDFLNGVISAAQ